MLKEGSRVNLSLSKKETYIVTAVIITCIAVLCFYYFLLYSPQKANLELKQSELETEQQLLAVVESKVNQLKVDTLSNTTTLQKRIPVKPLVEQVVLDLEKAEIVSGSFIESMDFSEVDFTIPQETTDASQGQAGETTSTEGAGTDESASSEQVQAGAPVVLKKLQVTLSIESPSYFELEEFLQELEDQERITEIQQLTFMGNEEITSLEELVEPLSYQVVLSVYYLPELVDLLDGLPQLESPAPSNKKNPFSQFDLPKETENGDEDDATPEDNQE